MADHHYSSKFYYKNFAFNPERSLVRAMRRNGEIIRRHQSIRRICFEVDYNTKEQEQEQNQLETKYARVLRDFIKKAYQGEYDFSEEFRRFVSFMIANNIHTRKIVIGAMGDGLENALDVLVDRDHRGKYDLSSLLADRIYDKLKTWEFMGLKKESNAKIFITSDKPVTIFNPSDRTISVSGRLEYNYRDIKQTKEPISITTNITNVSFEGNAAITFPINPSICIMGFSESRNRESYVNSLSSDILDHVNFITHAGCNSYVFSHSKKVLEITRDKTVYNMTNKGW